MFAALMTSSENGLDVTAWEGTSVPEWDGGNDINLDFFRFEAFPTPPISPEDVSPEDQHEVEQTLQTAPAVKEYGAKRNKTDVRHETT
jgi:hypothetical protein